ncbi:MAG: hypothetical protein JWQ38_586 [Flavipsychrobacter sp.]|nr:hypothetical protein [Flavipsychrobacter sp.]
MLPEFLKEFQEGLEKYKLDCIKIVATPTERGEITDIRQSKFSGVPYLPVNVDYPRDMNGIHMLLLAQINFAETPHLEGYPTEGILQFFVSKDWTEIGEDPRTDIEQSQVLYHTDTTEAYQTDFPFLTQDLLIESPIPCEYKLAFTMSSEPGGPGDARFDFNFNGKDWFEYSEQLDEEQQYEFDEYFGTEGHKIGGYTYFAQDDESKQDDVPILQIDSEEGIMIGDAGVLHFFLSKKDLKNRNFENAYFQWDCC